VCLKIFNDVRNSYTRGVNRKSSIAFLAQNWKVNTNVLRRKVVSNALRENRKVIKNAIVGFHMLEMVLVVVGKKVN
jgi:hypothetical protein